MGDNKDLTGGQDRARVAADQQCELSYFAGKHGISTDEARDIIARAGNSREKADELAERVSK